MQVLQKAWEAFQLLVNEQGQRESLEALGRIYLQLGELPVAEKYLHLALELARHNGIERAQLLNLLAGVQHRSGDYGSSLTSLEEALKIHELLNNSSQAASVLGNMGILYTSQGRYPEALTHLTRAYRILRDEAQDERMQGVVLLNLGHLYLGMGEPTKSIPYFEEALHLARRRQDRLAVAMSTLNIGAAQDQAGHYADAEPAFREALTISREIQYRPGEVSALDGLGNILAQRGQLHEAAAAHAEAAAIAREIEDLEGELDALNHLGQVQAELGDFPVALSSLERALTLAQEADHKKTVYEAHRALAGVYKRAGDFERALHHHELYHEAERALFNEESDKKTRELSAQFDVERARHEAEVQRLQREMAETAREEAEALVRERTHELEQAQVEIVTRLAVAAEYRDDLTGEHTWRVGHVSALIARELGLPDEDVALLRIAARLHDVGKIGIPDAILLKPGKFTPEEQERMKAHTLIGARILSGGHSRLLRMAEEIALSHHERWDGGGYPLGKAGHSIPVTGRIVSVADVFDALTSERPYKQAWDRGDALAELRRQAGTQFDPEVVEAALRVFTRADFTRLMRAETESAAAAEATRRS
ncbi:tetratricopeptide repeat protein [Deinococcus apachensis]|uniref:tetratricopeptide repeat protein n=1 Tax=Deinococcus apachensis TaxID=309886 RepID=UPI002480B8ED|nr:tetratricopeptide repeat protein [Deinococcus apachensis]